MKATLFGLILALLLSAAGMQAAVITGSVESEATGLAVPDVHVYLSAELGTYTDADGRFVLEDVAPGQYLLQVRLLGHVHLSQRIEVVEADGQVDLGVLRLVPKATQLEEVAVRQRKSSFKRSRHSSSQLISREEILLQQPLGTEELLKSVPGVHVAGDMGISNRLNVGIRGSYPRRADKILVMEDGVSIAPATYLAPSHYYNPPAERLDGIEVIKGADIIPYGANTLYGAINYITRRPLSRPGLTLDLKGGSRGLNSQYLTLGGAWDRTGAELQLLHKSFNGFQENSQSRILNATAKVYSELGDDQSVYLKLNLHGEKAKASYSGITPLTFALDPSQNPFDADDLSTFRFALDAVHKIALNPQLRLQSKIFAHQFKRDWWRQSAQVIAAADAAEYLGEEILEDRYAYLTEGEFAADDFVRVGKLTGGHEGTKARNRLFHVAGVQEKLDWSWKSGKLSGDFAATLEYHVEDFRNQEILNDSSRFARSGEIVRDERYRLHSVAGVVHNRFGLGRWSLTPYLRAEWIEMRERDLLGAANSSSGLAVDVKNSFLTLVPGATISVDVLRYEGSLEVYTGAYKGYNPPTTSFGFLTVAEASVSQSQAADGPNMKPETSLNFELGMRGQLLQADMQYQLTLFQNRISNFYAAGRKEAFQSLGQVKVQGLEAGISADVLKGTQKHKLELRGAVTLLRSRITAGKLQDSDLLKAEHTQHTELELIDKINAERTGYTVYFEGDSLINRALTADDFDRIERIEMQFGDGGIQHNRAPYTPAYLLNFGIRYGIRGFSAGLRLNWVGSQYTEYLNLGSETAEGAMGELPAYHSLDVELGYRFQSASSRLLDGLRIYVHGKNVTGHVYRASRLHRLSSGIMPAGFRQITTGIRLDI